VAEQPRLDVLVLERLPQQRVVHAGRSAHRQVVGGPPPQVDAAQLVGVERAGGGAGVGAGVVGDLDVSGPYGHRSVLGFGAGAGWTRWA
jgi:hypothetical protein